MVKNQGPAQLRLAAQSLTGQHQLSGMGPSSHSVGQGPVQACSVGVSKILSLGDSWLEGILNSCPLGPLTYIWLDGKGGGRGDRDGEHM